MCDQVKCPLFAQRKALQPKQSDTKRETESYSYFSVQVRGEKTGNWVDMMYLRGGEEQAKEHAQRVNTRKNTFSSRVVKVTRYEEIEVLAEC